MKKRTAVLSPSGIINDIGNGGQPWGTYDVYKNSMPAIREFAKLVAEGAK